MRAALSIAALAAGALAVPYKRDIVTEVNMVYVTDIVTVTAGQAAPSPAPQQQYGQPKQPQVYTSVVVESQPPAYTPPASQPAQPSYQAPPSSAPSAAPSGYAGICLAHHNLHRENHTVPALEWDDGLAASAATIAASCVYAHNVDVDGGGYGQNIAAGVAANNISSVITDLFYNGEEPYYVGNYGLPNPNMAFFDNFGHFTQIVWKGTTSVGCATQYCPGGLANVGTGVEPYFTVCNYKGPGNYAGEYADNVLQPIGMPTANWNTLL